MVAIQSPNIAVVGTGIAALSCAREIARLSSTNNGLSGARVTLCTSRPKLATQVGPKNQYIPKNGEPFYDYGVQYINPREDIFSTEVQRWTDLGFCTRLGEHEIGTVSFRDGFQSFGDHGEGSFVGNGGMGILMTNLIQQAGEEYNSSLEVLSGFPNQKNKISSLSKTSTGWMLHTKDGKGVGPFDAVIGGFAQHCLTDPFLLSGGAPAEGMLDCLRRVESNQLIAMQVSFNPPLKAPFTAAHVHGEESLSFISNNSRKPHQDGKIKSGDRQCWTLISSASFGEREFNTNKKGYRKIAEEEMLAALQRILGITNLGVHDPKINRVNHWEDGVSANMPPSTHDCLFDVTQNLGWCGDFCTEHPNLEGAAKSGRAMASTLESYFREGSSAFMKDVDSLLPSQVSWNPRTPNRNLSSDESLVDIGSFHHSRERLPAKFSHTNLVPSAINGYDKQAGRGAGGPPPKNRRKENQERSSNQRNGTGGGSGRGGRGGRGRGRSGSGRGGRGKSSVTNN